MPEIVRERDRLSEIFVEPKPTGDRPADRRDLDGVCQPCAEMVAGSVEDNLRLVFEPAERLGMDDASPITLEFRPVGMMRLGMLTAGGICRALGIRCESVVLDLLEFSACPHRGGRP